MSNIVRGVVEKTSTNYGKYAVVIDGEWYNTKMEWAKVKPVEGDEIEFDNGGKNYLKNVKILSGPSKGAGGSASKYETTTTKYTPKSAPQGRVFPIPPLSPERAIVRQNSVTNAVNLMKSFITDDVAAGIEVLNNAKKVIDIARIFESYSTGDLDKKEAEAAMAAMTATAQEAGEYGNGKATS